MDNADKLFVGILIDNSENKQRVLCAATIPKVKANIKNILLYLHSSKGNNIVYLLLTNTQILHEMTKP